MATVGWIAGTESGGIRAGTVDTDGANPVRIGECACVWVRIQNRRTNRNGSDNSTNVLIGDSLIQALELAPGEISGELPCQNVEVFSTREV